MKSQPSENLVISPYSIQRALALAYTGSSGETRREMARSLQFPDADESLNAGFSKLHRELANVSLRSANRLFVQENYPLRNEFLTQLKGAPDVSLSPLDFGRDTDAAAKTINAWVKKQTEGKIDGVVSASSFSDRTRLVLINALYLKTAWETPFEQQNTMPRAFHVRGAEATSELPTMQSTLARAYAKEDGLTVVALDCSDQTLQSVIILPDRKQTIQQVFAKLTPRHFARWAALDESKRPLIDLRLPKFHLDEDALTLSDALKTLGIKSAFDEPRGSANFDRMATRKADDYLFLSDVYHKTFVMLDEEGVEAAASTAVIALGAFSVDTKRPTPIPVHVDRPFLFVIQHRATGVCLFLGQINDPR